MSQQEGSEAYGPLLQGPLEGFSSSPNHLVSPSHQAPVSREERQQGRSWRVRVVEQAVQSVKSRLQNLDTAPQTPCSNLDCLPFQSGKLGPVTEIAWYKGFSAPCVPSIRCQPWGPTLKACGMLSSNLFVLNWTLSK